MPFIPVAEYGALPRPHIQIEGAVDLSGNGNQGIFPEEKRMHLKYGWEPKVSSIMCVCVCGWQPVHTGAYVCGMIR